MQSKPTTLTTVLDFLEKLAAAQIHYTLDNPTDRTLMVLLAIPGERWEVEFHEDGDIGVEVFKSEGDIKGMERLNDLFQRFSNETPEREEA